MAFSKRRAILAGLALSAIATLGYVYYRLDYAWRWSRTVSELRIAEVHLERAVEGFRKAGRDLRSPEDVRLLEMEARRLHQEATGDVPRDLWHGEIAIQVEVQEDGSLLLRMTSAGADRRFGTRDDVRDTTMYPSGAGETR